MNRSLALAASLGLAALAPGPALACDISADPSVHIRVDGGGATQVNEDCALGLNQYVVDEGQSITLTADAVEDGSCEVQDWSDVIAGAQASGRGYKIQEVFFRGNDPVSGLLGLVDFLSGPGTQPEDDFVFDLTATGGLPVSGAGGAGIGAFFTALGNIQAAYTSGGGFSVDPPSVEGYLKPHDDDIRVFWEILADPGIIPPEYGVTVNPNLAYNTSISKESRETRVPSSINVTFDTPTLAVSEEGSPPADRYHTIYAEAGIPWEFDDGEIRASACDSNGTTDPCDISGDIILTFSGTLIKRSNPASMRTNGPDGHPAVLQVAVRDKTPPLGGELLMSGGAYDLGDAEAGSPIPDTSFEIKLFDNNPYGQAADYTVRAWGLVERSTWVGEATDDAFSGMRCDPTLRDFMADDCFAGADRHNFRWVDLGEQSGAVAQQVSVGGLPAGLEVLFSPFEFAEPTGTHYMRQTVGSGDRVSYVEDGLKILYQIEGPNGARPSAPPEFEATEQHLQPITDDQVPEGMVAGGGTPPINGTLDSVDGASLAQACPACAGYKLVGVPFWDVIDNLSPSCLVIAHDTKYDKWYYFGENFSGDAHGNAEYDFAYAGSRGGDPDGRPNQAIADYPGGSEWAGGGDDGYGAQIRGYLSDFFPSNANKIPNGGDYKGLWIDEDTNVEFFVSGWDNNNGWDGNGGLASASLELYDGPSGGATASSSGRFSNITHLFRNPNRPDNLGDAWVRADCSDTSGKPRSVQVSIFIADNSLQIQSLEENRQRMTND